jgi:hypothetical protein
MGARGEPREARRTRLKMVEALGPAATEVRAGSSDGTAVTAYCGGTANSENLAVRVGYHLVENSIQVNI